MMGVEAFEKFEHERELLLLLAKGDKEIDLGEGHSRFDSGGVIAVRQPR